MLRETRRSAYGDMARRYRVIRPPRSSSGCGSLGSRRYDDLTRRRTMRALVVYESMFGNTKQVADAIGEGMRGRVATELVEVNEAPREIGADTLLVVGGPTHAFGMSRSKTRQDAMIQAGKDPEAAGIGMREWLESLDHAAET